MHDLTPFLAFVLGLFSTLHCVGMCGGIVGALSLSLPTTVVHSKRRLFLFSLAYNLGRISSYSLAGGLVGGLGYMLVSGLAQDVAYRTLVLLSALVMLLMGLDLYRKTPLLVRLESVGVPLWQQLEPLGRRLLPIQHVTQAFWFGAIWGWLPCGMVYSLLLLSAVGGGVWQGSAVMLSFGLGTLPSMLALGMLSSLLARWRAMSQVRQALGFSLMLVAVGYLCWHLFIDTGTPPHAHH